MAAAYAQNLFSGFGAVRSGNGQPENFDEIRSSNFQQTPAGTAVRPKQRMVRALGLSLYKKATKAQKRRKPVVKMSKQDQERAMRMMLQVRGAMGDNVTGR